MLRESNAKPHSRDNMKILFVSHWSGSGGAEKSVFELIEQARGVLGIPCACVVNRRGSLYQKLREIGVPCYIVPYRWWVGENIPRWKRIVRTLVNIPMTLAIAGLILWTRTSIVYTNTYTVCVGAFAAALTRKRHIWHIRELFENNTFDLGERLSTRLIDLLSDRVIVVSDAVAQKYSEFVAPHKIVRIHNALGIAKLDERTSLFEPGRLVTVGYLKESKGHEDAIRAVRILVDHGFNVNLHVVGDGDDATFKDRLKRLAHDLGIEDRVLFTGQLRDPLAEMRAAEVVLMCSRAEAFGRVTVEAMLMGRPVVAAAGGATPEIVKHGLNGLLYEPGEAAAAAHAVESLLLDHETSNRLARSARTAAVLYFGFDRYLSEWLSVLDSLWF